MPEMPTLLKQNRRDISKAQTDIAIKHLAIKHFSASKAQVKSVATKLHENTVKVDKMEDIQISLSNDLNTMKAEMAVFRSEMGPKMNIASSSSTQDSRSLTAVFGGLSFCSHLRKLLLGLRPKSQN